MSKNTAIASGFNRNLLELHNHAKFNRNVCRCWLLCGLFVAIIQYNTHTLRIESLTKLYVYEIIPHTHTHFVVPETKREQTKIQLERDSMDDEKIVKFE